MNILFLDELLPWPIITGGIQRSWQFIEPLSKNNTLHLLCMTDPAINTPGATRHLSKYFSSITCINEGHNQSQQFLSALSNKLHTHDFDVLFARYGTTAKYLSCLDSLPRARIIVDIVDIYPKLEKKRMKIQGRRGIVATLKQAILYNRIEKNFYRTLPPHATMIVCSEKDKKELQEHNVQAVVVIPNAIKVLPTTISSEISQRVLSKRNMLFCGSLFWQPNIDAIFWFISSIYPKIKMVYPDASFTIIGNNPDRSLRSVINNKDILLYSNVSDVRPYYQKASCVVIPLRMGAGPKLKTLEAAAYQKPIVTTSVGIEGLHFKNTTDCLVADTPEQFARSVLTLFHQPKGNTLAIRLVNNAFLLVKKHYDSAVIEPLIQKIFTKSI